MPEASKIRQIPKSKVLISEENLTELQKKIQKKETREKQRRREQRRKLERKRRNQQNNKQCKKKHYLHLCQPPNQSQQKENHLRNPCKVCDLINLSEYMFQSAILLFTVQNLFISNVRAWHMANKGKREVSHCIVNSYISLRNQSQLK